MSTEIMEALEKGDISPITFWVRHVEAWTLIAGETPLTDVSDFYNELADTALDIADYLVPPMPISLN